MPLILLLSQNPVLQHELLANLRRPRAFVLLFAYVTLLGVLVLLAWPRAEVLDMARPVEAQRLVGLFFFGQYLLASLMTPSFAAGAITGEKERLSYEMLLASPLKPISIVIGKLLASMTHLAILMLSSLPIVMLCLPLGGVGIYDVLAAYVAMISTIILYASISLWASSFFGRTASALVVAYLMILPMVIVAVMIWNQLAELGNMRFMVAVTVVPITCLAISALLWYRTGLKLLYPSDLGSGGKDAVDLETEARESVGLYIERNEWPDRLFAPPKRNDFLDEGSNPIYDKEMRSEIFSQGTLMLRLVIQISMVLAIPIMAICLYVLPFLAPWYVGYVLIFNMLCGPVFSAGTVSSERERQTLDLLLTTLITPWQILWGKLLSGLRVSTVLTSFLLWPIVLACAMPTLYWEKYQFLTMLGYIIIVLLTCVTTAMTALACSTIFSRTSASLVASYMTIATLFLAPVAVQFFADAFYQDTNIPEAVSVLGTTSPFSAAQALPLAIEREGYWENPAAEDAQAAGKPWIFVAHIVWTLAYNGILLLVLSNLFQSRWRVAK